MPKPDNPVNFKRIRFLILLFFSALTIVLSTYFVVLYLNTEVEVPVTPENKIDPCASIPYDDERGRKIARQYPKDANFPGFVLRGGVDVPDELGYDYNFFEYASIRVISTGKFSTTSIYNYNNFEKIAEVTQLEVYIDDKENFLDNNKPFNIAIKVYEKPSYDKNIASDYYRQNASYIEWKRLFNELRSESGSDRPTNKSTKEADNKLKIYNENLYQTEVTQTMLEEMFKEGTVWRIIPYLSSDNFSREHRVTSDYLFLLDKYYGLNKEYDFLNKIVNERSTVNVKSPLMLTNLRVLLE